MYFLRGGFIIRVRDAREEGRFQVFFFLIFIFFTWHPISFFIFHCVSGYFIHSLDTSLLSRLARAAPYETNKSAKNLSQASSRVGGSPHTSTRIFFCFSPSLSVALDFFFSLINSLTEERQACIF